MKRQPTEYQSISWQPDALSYAEMYGLTQENVELIVKNKSRPVIDPRTNEVGSLIMRYRSGDVVVVTGLRDPDNPVIMSVWVETNNKKSGSKKNSGTSGSSMPTTLKQLQRRILDDGFKIRMGGSHLRVEDAEGNLLTTLPATPSDYRSIPNAWKSYCRKKADYLQRKQDEE